jgi:predicted ATPase
MKLSVRNFRSVQNQDIKVAPITLIYGPNASGKSSLLYALLSLRNIVLNPNQQIPGFFNFQIMNLGGFREVVFDHDVGNEMEIGIAFEEKEFHLDYKVSLKDNAGRFTLAFSSTQGLEGQMQLDVSFPYQANQQTEREIQLGEKTIILSWTGLACGVLSPSPLPPDIAQPAQELVEILNSPLERLRQVAFVPHRRGFFQPQYSTTTVSTTLIQDTELASLLANDKYLEPKVSLYLEDIAQRQFRVRFQPGTALFSLDTIDPTAEIGVELVNDGLGVNQLVYLLTKALYQESKVVCIEEPEIHLHPAVIRKLARRLVQMTKDYEKRFLITTHSEPLVTAFLSLVAKGELPASDLACYLAVKEKKVSRFERHEVNEKGQVEGGLRTFMEGELEDIKAFLGLDAEEE